jgi:serine/threonine-protein kinase
VTGSPIALSPDGGRLAYLAELEQGRQLFLRTMDRLESVPIPHTRGAHLPFFSPDGEWLGFVADGRIRKVPLAGGPAITICPVGTTVLGASWGPNDVIVFATAAALWQVAAGGGAPRVLAASDTARGERYRWPEVLPSGRAAAFTTVDRTGFQLATVSLETGVVRPLDHEGTHPRFVAPHYIVFARTDGALLAAAFDENALTITGPALPVADGITVGLQGAAKLGIARTGALAHVPEQFSDRALAVLDRWGGAEILPVPSQGFHSARFSPDGRRIVADVISPGGSQRDIWVFDLERRTSTRITFDSGGRSPEWTPDGGRIVFATSSSGRQPGFAIRWIPADGSDSAETLLVAEHGQWPQGVAPDGRALIVQRVHPETQHDIWILPLDGERRSTPYLRTPFDERGAAVSPDGRWLAYVSDESGRDEIYVRAFPLPGPAVRISEGGGREPRWAPDGRELFYRSEAGMVTAAVAAASAMTVGRREVLFDDRPFVAIPSATGYDVHPDGRRLLMIRRGLESREVVVVLNWFDHLRAGRR